MKTFSTAIVIRSPAQRIWDVLCDAPRYPEWNSTVDRIDGAIAPGQSITVHAKISPGRAFPVRVAVFDTPRMMEWVGGMPLGLFTGRRTFRLTPRADGDVDFAMREDFTGLLAPLIGRSIPDLQPAFDAFARDLKLKAEART